MKKEIRDEIREGIHDELAVIRACNVALRSNQTGPPIRAQLETIRHDALTVLQSLLARLHPGKTGLDHDAKRSAGNDADEREK